MSAGVSSAEGPHKRTCSLWHLTGGRPQRHPETPTPLFLLGATRHWPRNPCCSVSWPQDSITSSSSSCAGRGDPSGPAPAPSHRLGHLWAARPCEDSAGRGRAQMGSEQIDFPLRRWLSDARRKTRKTRSPRSTQAVHSTRNCVFITKQPTRWRARDAPEQLNAARRGRLRTEQGPESPSPEAFLETGFHTQICAPWSPSSLSLEFPTELPSGRPQVALVPSASQAGPREGPERLELLPPGMDGRTVQCHLGRPLQSTPKSGSKGQTSVPSPAPSLSRELRGSQPPCPRPALVTLRTEGMGVWPAREAAGRGG